MVIGKNDDPPDTDGNTGFLAGWGRFGLLNFMTIPSVAYAGCIFFRVSKERLGPGEGYLVG